MSQKLATKEYVDNSEIVTLKQGLFLVRKEKLRTLYCEGATMSSDGLMYQYLDEQDRPLLDIHTIGMMTSGTNRYVSIEGIGKDGSVVSSWFAPGTNTYSVCGKGTTHFYQMTWTVK